MKHILISMLDYNGRDETLACLHSIDKLNLDGIRLTVLVIDNYPPKVFSLGNEKFKSIDPIVIKNKDALGFSGGHNVGFKEAFKKNVDYVLVINNDTLVDKNLLQELLKVAEENNNAGAIVPKIYFVKGREFHKERYETDDLGKIIWYAGGHMDWANIYGKHDGVDEVDKGQFDKTLKTDLMTGCCVLLRLDVLEKITGFDERYYLYFEDADMSQRIKNLGYDIWFAPKALVWHINAASTGGSGSRVQDYFFSRNRLLFGMTYAPIRTKVALLRESIRLLVNGREWQKKGIIDYFTHRFGKGRYPQ